MFKRAHYIGLAVIVVLTLTILNLPDGVTARMKLGIGSVFLPLFGLAGSARQVASHAGDAAVPRGELLRQNEDLRRENQQLKLDASHAREIDRENARLRQLIGWQQQKRWK